jgi:predicted esterase
VLLPFVGEWGGDPALSPERSPAPAAPVYLLHGAADNVIPAVEARRLAAHLAPHTAVRLLETPLITHAEADRAVTVADAWRVVSFWRSVQSQ